MTRFTLLVSLAALSACAHRRVDIAVRGAAVGPGDWDGIGATTEISSAAAAALAGYDPFLGAVGGPVVESVLSGYAPPDVTGSVRLSSDDPSVQGGVVGLPEVANSFTPLWDHPQLRGVPLTSKTALVVRLEDADPLNGNDLVAEVPVSSVELRRALRARRPLPIDYLAATDNQLVWLAVEVRPTPKPDQKPRPEP